MQADAPRHTKLKLAGRVIGWAAMIAALAYLVREISVLDFAGLANGISDTGWAVSVACGLVYAALLALLAKAWFGVALSRSGNADASDTAATWRAELGTYAPGVVAKYLPGSVFQYASRQILGAKHGLSQSAMGQSSLVEAILHLGAALAAAALISVFGWVGPSALIAIGLVLGFAGSSAPSRAFGLQISFFGGFALIVAAIANATGLVDDPARFAGLYLIAWLAGFLVPIAPGGIGVREAVLISLAGFAFGAAPTALLAVLIRLVTLGGDAVFGIAGYWIGVTDRSNRHASA